MVIVAQAAAYPSPSPDEQPHPPSFPWLRPQPRGWVVQIACDDDGDDGLTKPPLFSMLSLTCVPLVLSPSRVPQNNNRPTEERQVPMPMPVPLSVLLPWS